MRRGFLRELRNIAFIGIEPTVLCFFATNGCEGWCDLSFTAKCVDHLVQVKIQLGYVHQWFIWAWASGLFLMLRNLAGFATDNREGYAARQATWSWSRRSNRGSSWLPFLSLPGHDSDVVDLDLSDFAF